MFASRISWRKIAIISLTKVTALSNKCTSWKKKIVTLSVIKKFCVPQSARNILTNVSPQGPQSARNILKNLSPTRRTTRDARTGVHYWGAAPCPLNWVQRGHRCPSHNSTISNPMIDQDRLETNLLQLFAHTENSEWFSIIFVISFEVSIVAKHVNEKILTIMGALLHWTQTNSFELVVNSFELDK